MYREIFHFTVFGKTFTIYSYGVMLILAIITALFFIMRQAKKEKVEGEFIFDTVIYMVLGGFVGARLAYVLVEFSKFKDNLLSIIDLRQGGLTWYGGVLGGIVVCWLFARMKKVSLGRTLDIIAAPSMLGLAVGRIGCFLNGCCFGKITDFLWGVEFKAAGIAYPRHPTQIYEAIFDLGLFFYLKWWHNNRKHLPGETTVLTIILYSVGRFFIEFFRSGPVAFGIFSVGQMVCAGVIILCFIAWRVIKFRYKEVDENPS